MLYDPSNPVVQLCVRGIETEYGGDLEQADALYREAWQLASNDLEFLTAAHYLARTQADADETLKWNLLALEHARKVDENEVVSFLPSLFLNVAKSHAQPNSISTSDTLLLLRISRILWRQSSYSVRSSCRVNIVCLKSIID